MAAQHVAMHLALTLVVGVAEVEGDRLGRDVELVEEVVEHRAVGIQDHAL